ncbi:MAG: biotin--[acetyl-CoA-carboxylase] ligase [Flavobacteriales bacterium]|nr:MAG: biotin--[acetyl-CoA-carboxylase] ligase [Flavobacteriales bacterium]
MYQRLFIGNKLINLKEVDSTNSYLKQFLSDNNKEIEGLVVATENQISGRGQKGNSWESEKQKNLTFSIYLKPNIVVHHQFLISKAISLGIVHFLGNLGLNNLKIKWPNDIYCENKKIAGILIENNIRENKIYSSIVGIGLNVNQTTFNSDNNPTSIGNQIKKEHNLEELLNQLLFFIEKQYIVLKSGNEDKINTSYLDNFYWLNETRSFKINNKLTEGIITGVDIIGKLQVEINKDVETFDLKEIEFLR